MSSPGFTIFLRCVQCIFSLFLLCLCPAWGSEPVEEYSYSIVHLSDTQVLSSQYPSTLNFTFSYLESIKTDYNISGIVITGDLVNAGENITQWTHYSGARTLTTIPLYEVSGNHDIMGSESNYTAFDTYIGSEKRNWTAYINDFHYIGIGYTRNPLSRDDVEMYISMIVSDTSKIPLFATHNYFDWITYPSPLSPLGTSMKEYLVIKDPTFIMCGHMHGNILHYADYNRNTLVEDMTNYQALGNFSAGKLYTVYKSGGEVLRITVRDTFIVPFKSFGQEIEVYSKSMPMEYHINTGIFRPSHYENWILDLLMDGTVNIRDHYGIPTDCPLIADFNNDSAADRAVFRSGEWIIDYSMDGTVDLRNYYGLAGDIPLVGDFNNDGFNDRTVFRDGEWIFDYGMDGTVDLRNHYGMAGDIPLVGDFNNDGTPDRVVFRASATNNWIIDYNMDGSVDVRNHYGGAGDIPVVSDFNNDGLTDRAVFRNGEWIIDYNMDGSVDARPKFGQSGDLPLVWNI